MLAGTENMRSRLIGIVVSLAAVAAAGAGVFWYETVGRRQSATTDTASVAIAVATAPVAIGTAVDRLIAVGTLYAQYKVDVTPPETGHIVALPAQEGGRVAEGDVLLVLDSTIEKAALEDARAQLQFETEKFNRAKALSGRGIVAQSQLDEARAGVAAARSTVARSEVEVEHRTFTAPFGGRVGRTGYDVGSYVQPGDVVMTLLSTEVLYVDFHLPGSVVEQVRTGSVFTARIDGVAEPAEGVVSFIDPELDEASRSMELRGEIPNAGDVLRPGMFARLTLTLAERPGALLVPKEALVYELAGNYVYRIKDGKAERVAVELGTENGDMIEIRAGLAAGDAVVTRGRFNIRSGSAVRVVEGGTPGKS